MIFGRSRKKNWNPKRFPAKVALAVLMHYFFQIAISLGILPYIWADVPLVSYLGIVTLRISNRNDGAETGQGVLVHIAPSNIEEVVSWCLFYD